MNPLQEKLPISPCYPKQKINKIKVWGDIFFFFSFGILVHTLLECFSQSSMPSFGKSLYPWKQAYAIIIIYIYVDVIKEFIKKICNKKLKEKIFKVKKKKEQQKEYLVCGT